MNVDEKTVAGFGDEWRRFDHAEIDDVELTRLFDEYFSIFPWHALPPNAVGADFGCGSGRWARLVAPRVGHLHLVDASPEALAVARRNLAAQPNCEFHRATVETTPIRDASLDFAYSLGVLHHIPDTAAALSACVRKLKPGAPFLVYLYYRFDNRPAWYALLWRLSELGRRTISHLPNSARYLASQALAAGVYWPLARASLVAEKLGLPVDRVPLSVYRERSFYAMRTDALDRFGTRLEQRFTRDEIAAMMRQAGLGRVTFSEAAPFWCALGYREV